MSGPLSKALTLAVVEDDRRRAVHGCRNERRHPRRGVPAVIAFLKRLLCAHHYRWFDNIYGDEINAAGGMRSWWRCERCGHWALSGRLMPDLDKLIERIDEAKPHEVIEVGPNAPDLADVWEALAERMQQRKAQRESEDGARLSELIAAPLRSSRTHREQRDAALAEVADLRAKLAATAGMHRDAAAKLAQHERDQCMPRDVVERMFGAKMPCGHPDGVGIGYSPDGKGTKIGCRWCDDRAEAKRLRNELYTLAAVARAELCNLSLRSPLYLALKQVDAVLGLTDRPAPRFETTAIDRIAAERDAELNCGVCGAAWGTKHSETCRNVAAPARPRKA
jgi:hypothetical protein